MPEVFLDGNPPLLAKPKAAAGYSRFSKFLRRSHMYAALFLTPWFVMYSASTVVLNHGPWFAKFYGGNLVQWEKIERPYTREFPAGEKPRTIAQQILTDINMDGRHSVRVLENGISITREAPGSQRRIIYLPDQKKLVIDKQVFRVANMLSQLHTRAGYYGSYGFNHAWAASVDLSIVATIFWLFSGYWMWWQLKVTRLWGIFFTLAGIGLFSIFLVF